MSDHHERLARNDESRNRAEHHALPWEAEELEFLLVFFADAKGDPEAEREVAEALGRTIEACRQRFYQTRRGQCATVEVRTTTTETTTVTYRGLMDDPDDRWWEPGYYTNDNRE